MQVVLVALDEFIPVERFTTAFKSIRNFRKHLRLALSWCFPGVVWKPHRYSCLCDWEEAWDSVPALLTTDSAVCVAGHSCRLCPSTILLGQLQDPQPTFGNRTAIFTPDLPWVRKAESRAPSKFWWGLGDFHYSSQAQFVVVR